jgi:hypothetical protein
LKESGRFLKKAAQKLLLVWACGAETAQPKLLKFFCSQKEALLSSCGVCEAGNPGIKLVCLS